MQKKTVGQVAVELQQQANVPISAIEVAQAQEKEYLDNLMFAVKHARKEVKCPSWECEQNCKDRLALKDDLFIEVLLKKEEKLENVLRNYFVVRKTCPLPFYDHTVYKYEAKKEDISYLWTVPDRETCMIFIENKNKIVPSEQSLLKMILMFEDGSLRRLAKKLNGETMNDGGALIIGV